MTTTYTVNDIEQALEEVHEEVIRAKELFPGDFPSEHHAIAVIREEYLELEHECFKNQKKYDREEMRKEAKQLAAMCIRFMTECAPIK